MQAVKVTGKGGLEVGGVEDVLDLVRDSFTGDVETVNVDSCEKYSCVYIFNCICYSHPC